MCYDDHCHRGHVNATTLDAEGTGTPPPSCGWGSSAPQSPVRNKGASVVQSASEQRLGDDEFPRSPDDVSIRGVQARSPQVRIGGAPQSQRARGRPGARGQRGGAAHGSDLPRGPGAPAPLTGDVLGLPPPPAWVNACPRGTRPSPGPPPRGLQGDRPESQTY